MTNYNEESITASKKNMIANVNWIMIHGDAMNNQKCAEIISDLEKSIMAAKRYARDSARGFCYAN